uniref:Uncharacterized protein n=1 Tax=Rhizophora mucronata TaxID=61149 RepID=A0A2P2KKD8_RHIMU
MSILPIRIPKPCHIILHIECVFNGKCETNKSLLGSRRWGLRERNHRESFKKGTEICSIHYHLGSPSPPPRFRQNHDPGHRNADHHPDLGVRGVGFDNIKWLCFRHVSYRTGREMGLNQRERDIEWKRGFRV